MDHPIGLHLPSKIFCALVGHAGEGFFGPKTEASLCRIIDHWIAMTPAAPRPWLDDDDLDDNDGLTSATATPPTTPSRLANTGGCGTRNAWRITWLRFPGSTRWQRAAECRR